MNRTQRRAAKKAKPPAKPAPRRPGKIIRPWPHEVHHVFAPIEWMFDELRQGKITEMAGQAAFRDIEGNWFTVVPAITGWIDVWQQLNQRYGLNIDLAPLQALADALEHNELMTQGDIEAAYRVIARCRQAYRNMDVYEVKSIVTTIEIAIALAGADAEPGEKND